MAHIEIEGETPVRLPTQLAECEEFGRVTREREMYCSESGEIGGRWTGVPLAGLLDSASMPPDTTHLLVECRDGFRVCIEVTDALDGLVAYRRDGDVLEPDGLRLIGPDIGSTRSAKGVERIEPVSLGPHDDPEGLEELDPNDKH